MAIVNICTPCYIRIMSSTTTSSRPYHHGDLRRALIDAGVAIVTEEQNWGFSLREVARRAGVSHNAPYNHFAEKRDLLDAVAAVGFDTLRHEMRSAMDDSGDAATSLLSIARAYVTFAAGNPALYRLMFGSELAKVDGIRPELSAAAGSGAKMVLRDVIVQGAGEHLFCVNGNDESSIAMAVLSAWSTVHGLAMLVVDGKTDHAEGVEALAEAVMRHFLEGLRKR